MALSGKFHGETRVGRHIDAEMLENLYAIFLRSLWKQRLDLDSWNSEVSSDAVFKDPRSRPIFTRILHYLHVLINQFFKMPSWTLHPSYFIFLK